MGVDITLISEATGTCITMVTMVRGWLSHMRSGGTGTPALKWTLWWKEEALLVECGPLEAMGIHVNRRAGRPVSSLQPRMDPKSHFGSFITCQNWSSQEGGLRAESRTAGQMQFLRGSWGWRRENDQGPASEHVEATPNLLEVTQEFHRKVRLDYCTLGEK